MSTLLTGATGFVGRHLLPQLKQTTVCTRNADRAKQKLGPLIDNAIQWDPAHEPLELGDRNFDAVINLMGEPIAEGRWTKEKKQRIRDSRVLGTRKLVDALIESKSRPSVLVSASAVGLYGDCGDEVIDESHPPGSGFLADVCQQWESEANRLAEHGVRVVNFRIGIVLGRDGGALEKLIPIFRWGVGGRLGNGQQFMPWIHIDDLTQLIVWCCQNETISGPLNATAPNPVRNTELTQSLARQLKRPAIFPVPQFAARLALGEFADSLFDSQRVIPDVAINGGYDFQFPDLDAAIEDLVP